MKKFLVSVLFSLVFLLPSSVQALTFETASMSNTVHSARTNALNAKTEAEWRDVLKNVQNFLDQVYLTGTNTPPAKQKEIGTTLTELSKVLGVVYPKILNEVNRLKARRDGMHSHTAAGLSYGLEVAELRGTAILNLNQQIKELEPWLLKTTRLKSELHEMARSLQK